MKKNQDNLKQLRLDMIDVIEKYDGLVPDYEIVHSMILAAVSMSLYCAPNSLVGMRTIMASVADGINEFEETPTKENKGESE